MPSLHHLALFGLLLAASAGVGKGELPPAETFPKTLTIADKGKQYNMARTGTADRKFLVFHVYEMAHYMEQEAVQGQEPTMEQMLEGRKAMHIRMRFVRDLPCEKIQAELKKSMLRNAQESWIENSEAEIETFLNSIDRDANKDDVLTLSWFPDGRTVAAFNGEPAMDIHSADFARILWSIWFGEKPVVKRQDLLKAFERG
jgi:hypothetical protein